MKGDCSQENSEDIKLITHIEKNTRQLIMQVLCTYQCMSCTLRDCSNYDNNIIHKLPLESIYNLQYY